MNKSELIDAIADSADLSKAAAGRALDSAIDVKYASLCKKIIRREQLRYSREQLQYSREQLRYST